MFCRYSRWKLAQSLHFDKPLGRLLDRHLQRCDECRSFYELQQEMSERLGRDAVMSQSELSEALNEKIMNMIVPGNSVSSQNAYSPEVQRIWRRVLVAAACVGLVLLGSVLVWLTRYGGSDNAERGSVSTKIVINMDPRTAVDTLAIQIGAKEDLSGWSGFIEKPMVEEWETLSVEAESALQFIVSCVAVDIKQNAFEGGGAT